MPVPGPRRRTIASAATAVGAACIPAWIAPVTSPRAAESLAPSSDPAITELLEEQREAWNRGDIDAFLRPYWKGEGLTFSSGGETRRGFAATRERYLNTYPDRRTMGRLTFADLETTTLGPDAVLVLGTWRLEREAGAVGGNFTLVLRRLDGAWTIVHDHTSRRP